MKTLIKSLLLMVVSQATAADIKGDGHFVDVGLTSNQHIKDLPVWMLGLIDWYSLFFPSAEASPTVSPVCSAKSQLYEQGVSSLSLAPALEMFDASGKVPDGLAAGNTFVLGSYEACVKINESGLRGKYCKGSIRFRFNKQQSDDQSHARDYGHLENIWEANAMDDAMGSISGVLVQSWQGLVWGLCVPEECLAQDLTGHTNAILSSIIGADSRISVSASFSDNACFTDAAGTKSDFDTVDIVYISVMSVVFLIIFAGTGRDLWKRYGPFLSGRQVTQQDEKKLPEKAKKESVASQILGAFSVYRNGTKLFDCTESSSKSIRCLHGIRFFSMTWVIFGHGGMQLFINNTVGRKMLDIATHNIEYQVFFNAYLSVDTFFFLSGFLLCYVLVKELEKNDRGSYQILANAYLHRYLRLTPAYLAVIGFYASLKARLFNWPPYTDNTAEDCRELWWKMILYIHTLFDGETTDTIPRDSASCMPQSWFLSVDMQMFLVGPPIILLLYTLSRRKSSVLFYSVGLLVSLIAILIPGILTWVYNFGPTDVLQSDKPGVELDQHNIIYKKPWSRAAPYTIGILLGFWFHQRKGKMPQLSRWLVIPVWLLAFSVALLIEYGMYPYNQFEDASYSTFTAVTYATLHRPVWALCLCWVVVCCHSGYGGPINSLLSWPALVPLSRLTYSAYLVHYIVLDLFWHSVRPMYKNELFVSWIYLGNVVVSLAFALVLALAVEIPVINLDKILLGNNKTTNNHKKHVLEKV